MKIRKTAERYLASAWLKTDDTDGDPSFVREVDTARLDDIALEPNEELVLDPGNEELAFDIDTDSHLTDEPSVVFEIFTESRILADAEATTYPQR